MLKVLRRLVHSLYTLTFLVMVGLISVGTLAEARSIMPQFIHDITQKSDAWVKAYVIDVKVTDKKKIKTPYDGDYVLYTMDVVLDIRRSTEATLSDTIKIKHISSQKPNRSANEYSFWALTQRKDGWYSGQTRGGIRQYFINQSDTYDVMWVAPLEGKVLWQLLKDTRVLVDNDGEVPDRIRERWNMALRSKNPAIVKKAQEFLKHVKGGGGDMRSVAESVLIQYKALPPWPDRIPGETLAARSKVEREFHDAYRTFNPIFKSAGKTIAESGNVEAADMILEIYHSDETMQRYLSDVESIILSLTLVGLTPERLEVLKTSKDNGMKLDYHSVDLLIKSPNPAADELIWMVLEGLEPDESDAYRGCLWALGVRSNPRLTGYLLKHHVSWMNRKNDLSDTAWAFLNRLPKTEEERVQFLDLFTKRVVEGDSKYMGLMNGLVTPEDTHLLNSFAKFKPTLNAQDPQPRMDQSTLEYYYLTNVVMAIPDPVFISTLKKLKSRPRELLLEKALFACGDESTGIEWIEGRMNNDLDTSDIYPARDDVDKRIVYLYALSDWNTPETQKLVLRYVHPDYVDKIESSFRKILTKKGILPKYSEDVWRVSRYRDAALVALTKTHPEKALPVLKTAYNQSSMGTRMTAAMCLYTLGEPTGQELVDAFRMHTEHTLEGVEPSWYQGDGWRRVNMPMHQVVLELNSDKLNAVFLERLAYGAGESDSLMILQQYEQGRFDPQFLDLLVVQLDNPYSREHALKALSKILGRDYSYHQQDSRKHKDDVVKTCKHAVVIYQKALNQR